LHGADDRLGPYFELQQDMKAITVDHGLIEANRRLARITEHR